MALNMSIVVTSGVAATEVPEDVAQDLAEAYAALADLPVNRAVVVDFTSEGYEGPAKVDGKPATDAYKSAWNARRFVKQGKSWAAGQTGPNGRALSFARKGDIKGLPSRVTFRIYEVREDGEAEASE